MELKNILDPRIVDLKMNSKTKDEALYHLSHLLKEAGYIDDCKQFVDDIYLREKEGMTGIGSYIAIPHGKSESVHNVGIAIGKMEHEIEWETLDDLGVKIIFLFAVSNNNDYAQTHLGLLAQIAGKLGNDQAIKALQKVKTFDELVSVFM
jgi:fructose PTS system EIIA component